MRIAVKVAVFRSLVESGFPERNLQVHCGFKTKKIQISAQLDIGRADVRDLPPPDGGGGDDDIDFGTASAALIFTVAPADGAVSTCCLSLSPYLERVLDGRLDFNHLVTKYVSLVRLRSNVDHFIIYYM